ncbi:hypothetical protein [Streptomyces sp. NPDC048309]|uniref:hypothetical protein n=1 Tax=Streptomyces sp. NPDC048309 TaxID=3154618 RepID=UPI0033FC453D
MPSRRTLLGWLVIVVLVLGAAAWYIEDQVNADAGAKPAVETAEIEVTGSDLEYDHGHMAAVAEYVIHNTSPGPLDYTVTFGFGRMDDSGGMEATKTVTRHVEATRSYTGKVSVPWAKANSFEGVRVLDTQRE